MASIPSKSKKPRNKPPKGRPAATSAISQPTVEDASSTHSLSSFSPNGELFAFLSLAVDRHRLRVYDTVTSQCVAELVLDSSRVASLCWARFEASQSDEGPKRKRKRKGEDVEEGAHKPPPLGIALGLANGSIVLFSPAHGKIVKTISHPSSTSSIVSMTGSDVEDHETTQLWTSGADGVVRLWNYRDSSLLGSWKSDERIPYSCIAARPATSDNLEHTREILTANYAIQLLSMEAESPETLSAPSKPSKLASFTGHASPVKSLHWASPSTFYSTAEADRFVYLWDSPAPDSSISEGRVVASIPLDSDVRNVAISPSTGRISHILLALSASGRVAVFPVPSKLDPPAGSKSKSKIPVLSPSSTITVSTSKKQASSRSEVISATFVQGEDGKIRIARLSGGVKPVFDIVEYTDATGESVPEVTVPPLPAGTGLGQSSDEQSGPQTVRYTENASVAIRSGVELGQDASMDDLAMGEIEGELDADLAEMSLGQRLTAITGEASNAAPKGASSDDEDVSHSKKAKNSTPQAVPAASLTRTLIQALHSSDSGLLETCLAHSNATLIQNTVQRLPSQLAVPLVTACVERLGRGKRVGRGKGGGGGAGAQRGTGLVRWVRAVLVVHGGHLLTMPDLVARLSGLHTTLTSRLALQESLLALSGRLDMVLSQIEMRSSTAPAPLPVPKVTKNRASRKKQSQKKVSRYVEGESESEDEAGEADEMDVQVESGDDAGSVEDVELGASDDEGSSEDEDDEDEDDDDSDSDDDLKTNGFVDDEAEEYSEDDESGSE